MTPKHRRPRNARRARWPRDGEKPYCRLGGRGRRRQVARLAGADWSYANAIETARFTAGKQNGRKSGGILSDRGRRGTALNLAGHLVATQPTEDRPTKKPILCPFGELDLSDKLRSEPVLRTRFGWANRWPSMWGIGLRCLDDIICVLVHPFRNGGQLRVRRRLLLEGLLQ